MRYNTRSLDCEIIFDKKVDKSIEKKKKSEKVNKYIKKEKKLKEVAKYIKKEKKSKKVNKYIKKEKKSKKVNKYNKKEKNFKEIKQYMKKEKKPKNLATKFKEKFLIKNKFSMLKNWNKCFYFLNKLNEWEKTKPCFVILEKINVKQLKSNFRAPKVYIKRELNQSIISSAKNPKRINVKRCLNNNELLKPCSVVLKKCDSSQKSDKTLYKIKQEIVDCDEDLYSHANSLSHSSEQHASIKNFERTTKRFKIKQEIECIDEDTNSFNSSLDPFSVQHETESAITNVTESLLCLEQEKKKRFKDSNNVVEILCNDYFCTHCNKVLPSKKALYYHICSNKLKKGFLCEICFKYFDFYHLLTKHKCSRSLPLSCSGTVKNRRKGSPSPFHQFPIAGQSFRESNKFECVSSGKYCKLKENNPPNNKKNIFLKNPACASTSSGYCSSTLEFHPHLWQSDESDNGL